MAATDLMFSFPGVPEYVTGVRNFTGKTLYIRNQLSIGQLNPTAQLELFTQLPFTQGLRIIKNNAAITDLFLGGSNGGTSFIIDNTTGNLTVTPGNGQTSFASTLQAGTLVATSSITFAGSLGHASGLASSNLFVGAASVVSASTVAQMLFAGASTIYYRVAFYGTANNSGGGNTTAGISYGAVVFANSSHTTATTGTHALYAQLVIKAGSITNSGATVTNTATVYIEGASSASVSGKNYSLWIAAGQVRIDDNIAAPATTIGAAVVNFYGANATNFLGDPNLWLRMNVGGTNYKIPLYT